MLNIVSVFSTPKWRGLEYPRDMRLNAYKYIYIFFLASIIEPSSRPTTTDSMFNVESIRRVVYNFIKNTSKKFTQISTNLQGISYDYSVYI